jgi:hypothetical protein
MPGFMAVSFGNPDERRMQAFVDKELQAPALSGTRVDDFVFNP